MERYKDTEDDAVLSLLSIAEISNIGNILGMYWNPNIEVFYVYEEL